MENRLEIIGIEGCIGIGKTTLLKNLNLERYNGKVDVLYEPHEKFNTFLHYKPLDLLYTDPKENAFICQLHIFDICRQELEDKLRQISPECQVLITDRSIMSPTIFNNTLLDVGYLTKYQYDFIIEYAKQNIQRMETEFPIVKPTAYFYLKDNNDNNVSVQNIKDRDFSKENEFPPLREYLHTLTSHMNEFMVSQAQQDVVVYWEEMLALQYRIDHLHGFLQRFLNK